MSIEEKLTHDEQLKSNLKIHDKKNNNVNFESLGFEDNELRIPLLDNLTNSNRMNLNKLSKLKTKNDEENDFKNILENLSFKEKSYSLLSIGIFIICIFVASLNINLMKYLIYSYTEYITNNFKLNNHSNKPNVFDKNIVNNSPDKNLIYDNFILGNYENIFNYDFLFYQSVLVLWRYQSIFIMINLFVFISFILKRFFIYKISEITKSKEEHKDDINNRIIKENNDNQFDNPRKSNFIGIKKNLESNKLLLNISETCDSKLNKIFEKKITFENIKPKTSDFFKNFIKNKIKTSSLGELQSPIKLNQKYENENNTKTKNIPNFFKKNKNFLFKSLIKKNIINPELNNLENNTNNYKEKKENKELIFFEMFMSFKLSKISFLNTKNLKVALTNYIITFLFFILLNFSPLSLGCLFINYSDFIELIISYNFFHKSTKSKLLIEKNLYIEYFFKIFSFILYVSLGFGFIFIYHYFYSKTNVLFSLIIVGILIFISFSKSMVQKENFSEQAEKLSLLEIIFINNLFLLFISILFCLIFKFFAVFTYDYIVLIGWVYNNNLKYEIFVLLGGFGNLTILISVISFLLLDGNTIIIMKYFEIIFTEILALIFFKFYEFENVSNFNYIMGLIHFFIVLGLTDAWNHIKKKIFRDKFIKKEN